VVSIIWDLIQNSKSDFNYLNIAWGKKTTLNQLIQIIQNDLGLNLKCVNKDSRMGDIKNSQNDGLKIRKLYPLVNPIEIKSALRLTANWYLDQNL
jgi:UDP-glucose 4-epimerase